MGIGDALLLGVTFIMLSLAIYLFVSEVAVENVQYKEFVADATFGVLNETSQFYPNMRFESKEIGYAIESVCSEANKIKIIDGLEEISSKTLVKFHPSTNPNILFECSSRAPSADDRKNHLVAGAARPRFINATRFFVIQQTNISLYIEESCERPIVVIHETLHALGFDHVNNEADIMYPISDCEQQISSDNINEINRLYSIPQQGDLVILDLKANTTKRFLNFDISIANLGLKDTENVKLRILGGGEVLKEFDLKEIPIGQTKMLNVQNLHISLSDDLNFVVSEESGQDLHSEDNSVTVYAENS